MLLTLLNRVFFLFLRDCSPYPESNLVGLYNMNLGCINFSLKSIRKLFIRSTKKDNIVL